MSGGCILGLQGHAGIVPTLYCRKGQPRTSRNESRVKRTFLYSRSNGKHHKHFLFKKNLTSEQHSANCICKTCLLSDPFRLTNVDFFREFCNNTLDARL